MRALPPEKPHVTHRGMGEHGTADAQHGRNLIHPTALGSMWEQVSECCMAWHGMGRCVHASWHGMAW